MNAQLKKELKAKAKELKTLGCPGYINLSIASIEKLQAYLDKWGDWTPSPSDDVPEDAPPAKAPAADFSRIERAKTLSELGAAIAALAGSGDWQYWEMNLWTKNGECRVYMKDCNYRNPKDRGFYLVNSDGTYTSFISKGDFPRLPPLPVVANDLIAHPLSPEERAKRNLDNRFGEGQWSQFDFEDELEREEYQ